jgi:hypothetical protein
MEAEKRRPGRPKKYAGTQRGAPALTLRLEPELLEWVREHGGQEFLRGLIQHARQTELNSLANKARAEDRQAFFEQVQAYVAGALKDSRNSHQGEVVAGSVGKRVAGQLWSLLHPDAGPS